MDRHLQVKAPETLTGGLGCGLASAGQPEQKQKGQAWTVQAPSHALGSTLCALHNRSNMVSSLFSFLVGRLDPHKCVHPNILNLGICYVMWQRGLCSKVTDPQVGRASGLFRWSQFNPRKPLKAKNFLRLETGEMRQEGRSERFKE